MSALSQHPWQVVKASIWGMSAPWTLVISALLGLWLMFVPAVLGNAAPLAHIDHLAGALLITV